METGLKPMVDLKTHAKTEGLLTDKLFNYIAFP